MYILILSQLSIDNNLIIHEEYITKSLVSCDGIGIKEEAENENRTINLESAFAVP